MKDTARNFVWSCLSLGIYLVLCELWARHRRSPDAVYVCAVLWPILCIAISRIWGLSVSRTLGVVIGAAVFAAIWSLTLVDFPSRAVENLPPAGGWLLSLAPLLLTALVGFVLRSRGALAAALMVALAHPALLPLQIWNSNAHVVGGWSEYPFPGLVGQTLILAITVPIGLGGGYVGWLLRRRLTRRTGQQPH